MIDVTVTKHLGLVAARLTNDLELRKDLVQEMELFLLRVECRSPGQTRSWYVKGCEFHARNFLRLGRSIDSQKRSSKVVPMRSCDDAEAMAQRQTFDQPDPHDLRSGLFIYDLIELIQSLLTPNE